MEPNLSREGKFIEDIKHIKTKRNALTSGLKQFTDKEFPTEIGIESLNDFTIHWKRIKDLDTDPRLYQDGSPIYGELQQGLIEDNPLLAVLSAIANHPKLMNYIFPRGQDFSDPGYCGLFYFRFWRMGKWVYVIVDDRIPIVGHKKTDEPRKKDKTKSRDVQAAGSSKNIEETKNDEREEEKLTQPGNEKEQEKITEDNKKSSKQEGDQPPQTEGEGRMSVNPELAKDEMKPDNPEPIKHSQSISVKPEDVAKTTDDQKEDAGTSIAQRFSEVNFDAKRSQVQQPDNRTTSATPEQKTELSEEQKKDETLERTSSTVKRASESTKKTSMSMGSKGSSKNKEEDVDTENVSNRNNGTIFVRVFGSCGKLYYWATLLEKACAKAYGGYSQLPKISITQTLLDLTGGATEIFYTSHLPRGFFLDFKNYSDTHAIILAATDLPIKQEEDAEPKDDQQTSLFSVTSVILADFRKSLGRDKIVGFVRLSNPYGEVKWMEPWSGTSQEWQILPELVTSKLKMESRRFGEFYFTYKNFMRAFSVLFVCTVPDGEKFNMEGYFGEWTKPRLQYNLCRIDDLRFHEFPQHKVWVRNPNEKDSDGDVIISLVQNGRCCCSETPSYNITQLFLFLLDMGRTYILPLNFEFFRYNRPIGCSNVCYGQETTARFKIQQGYYLVVPVMDYSNIFHPCQANDYVLRVITPAKFPKPPPPPISTFTDSENLNIYFDLAETIEEPKSEVTTDSRQSFKSEIEKTGHKEKTKGKKKKLKH
uniref:Calpain-A n=1 Tax=Lygus hesperus TaxID=30085 RepID=A0A0A9XV97_LYGHE